MQVIAVVPIFMSAGAAVLPTLLAGATSVVAIILKPKMLFRLIKARPLAFGGVAGTLIALCFATWWFMSATPARASKAAGEGVGAVAHYDWARIAEEILAQEKAGKAPTAIAAAELMDASIVNGRDYSRCGHDGGVSPLQLQPLWSFRPDATMFISSPVVAGKRIYAAASQADVVGYTGLLVCLDAETGKPLWQHTDAKGEPLQPYFSSPALTRDGKYLIIGEGLHDNHDCSLRCFDAATGEPLWAVKTTLHIESSPAIFEDIVVAGAGAIEGKDGKPTGDPGHVIGVRISDGKELWRQPVNDPESTPAIDEAGIVYIGSGFNGSAVVAIRSAPDEELHAKKLNRIVWKTPVAQPVTSPITIAGDLVIAGEGNSDFVFANPDPQGYVVALDRKTGTIRWQTKFGDGVLGNIALHDGTLICPVRTGEVAALDLTGKNLWHTRISGKAPVLAGCAFTGKLVYAVSDDGYLAVLDPKDGKVLEKVYLNDQAKPGGGLSLCAPQVVNGRVIVGSETGGLRCFVGARNVE